MLKILAFPTHDGDAHQVQMRQADNERDDVHHQGGDGEVEGSMLGGDKDQSAGNDVKDAAPNPAGASLLTIEPNARDAHQHEDRDVKKDAEDAAYYLKEAIFTRALSV